MGIGYNCCVKMKAIILPDSLNNIDIKCVSHNCGLTIIPTVYKIRLLFHRQGEVGREYNLKLSGEKSSSFKTISIPEYSQDETLNALFPYFKT
jgi:hypothetical protein